MKDSFNTRTTLDINGTAHTYASLRVLDERFRVGRLPFSLKILLENLLRHEDGEAVHADDIAALAQWRADDEPSREIAFTPARVLMQDFTGVPAVVDLAAMRDAMAGLGGAPSRINPLSPAELVIDHSVQVDVFGRSDALKRNAAIEFERNTERYAFLRWGQRAFSNLSVVPPDMGIVHQVNLEHLARVVFRDDGTPGPMIYPDTLVGTDSHTTMVNGLGVLGWGVGGIEAEAAMLGQPLSMLIPQVVGFRLTGALPDGATATDLVLTVTQMLRQRGVVGSFVEFFGSGLGNLALADRATLANMAPEYGATCGIFPIDGETLRYLALAGRSPERLDLVETYAKAQGLWRDDDAPEAEYTDILELDMGSVEPCIAGPTRPQDRIALSKSKASTTRHIEEVTTARKGGGESRAHRDDGQEYTLRDGAVVIAAITSCTNTSNPMVMVAAGLVAKKAVERGLRVPPWVKTSLAPGSLVVSQYLQRAGLDGALEALGFHTVGYGCTTCIGNSGPLPPDVSRAIAAGELVVASVLSGNRNFEGRIHPEVRMNFLASPPLVVAYALAGRADIDLTNEPLGDGSDGTPVYLKDIWPTRQEISALVTGSIDSAMFVDTYANVHRGDTRWQSLVVPDTDRYAWDDGSTYVRHPPFFEGMSTEPPPLPKIHGARCLALLGDSITTDHISPAGAIAAESPAGRYLREQGVEPVDFNSYGARRGNHEVMMRGTFANIRLRNRMAPGTEGGLTVHHPSGDAMTIYDAAMRYQAEGIPLIVLAGAEYGTGSSRDWAAKGTRLLGVRAVIATSFERIHRSNLVGMGVLPLAFMGEHSADSLGLRGDECFEVAGIEPGGKEATVTATGEGAEPIQFPVRVRVDTPKEWKYLEHGGILHYVLRKLLD